MRLIDADKLEISEIAEFTDEYGDTVPVYGVTAEDIDNAPTVDAIISPVRVGQIVWYIEGGYYNSSRKRPMEKTVTEINLKCQSGKTEWGFIADGTRYRFKSIGKTVFTTREAAEAALKARKQNAD